jgi:hypothetical protein
MKAIAVFMLFIGMFLVVQGYYSQSTKCPEPTVEVKYIPRSLYEEQLPDPSDPTTNTEMNAKRVEKHFKSMFEDVNPWLKKKGF